MKKKEKEKKFLDYKHVHIHFTFSLSWDITQLKFNDLRVEFQKLDKRWELLHIHERPIFWDKKKFHKSYQPNLISENIKVLQIDGMLEDNATICIPIEEFKGQKLNRYEKILTNIQYTLRIFDNGTGIFTFIVCLDRKYASFKNIHRILRLAPNIANDGSSDFAQSFLLNPFIKGERDRKNCFILNKLDTFKYVTLQQLFWCLFTEPYPEWLRMEKFDWAKLWLDDDLLGLKDVKLVAPINWQSPFVFIIAEIENQDYERYIKNYKVHEGGENTVKEIASIACKMTLDNRNIEDDFNHLDLEYIKKNLGYSEEYKRLTNLCLDDRLFFTFSRRGAIAITSDMNRIPSNFVVPSLVNLIEILRARWHLCNIVNISLDKAIHDASYVSNNISPAKILDDIYKWRALFALYLRDPVPSLFDGGSITEIAEMAGEKLWLNKLTLDTFRKFDTLDKLLKDFLERKRVEQISQYFK